MPWLAAGIADIETDWEGISVSFSFSGTNGDKHLNAARSWRNARSKGADHGEGGALRKQLLRRKRQSRRQRTNASLAGSFRDQAKASG
jgi:hypothetical protein